MLDLTFSYLTSLAGLASSSLSRDLFLMRLALLMPYRFLNLINDAWRRR